MIEHIDGKSAKIQMTFTTLSTSLVCLTLTEHSLKTADTHFLSRAQRAFTKKDHCLYYRASLK